MKLEETNSKENVHPTKLTSDHQYSKKVTNENESSSNVLCASKCIENVTEEHQYCKTISCEYCQNLEVRCQNLESDLQLVRTEKEMFSSYHALLAVFRLVEPYISESNNCTLVKCQKLIIVLMKLRLSLTLKDLAYRFDSSIPTVSRVFHSVIEILYIRLRFLVFWPEREELRKTMPMSFRANFGLSVSAIIDCFEIKIETPSANLAVGYLSSGCDFFYI